MLLRLPHGDTVGIRILSFLLGLLLSCPSVYVRGFSGHTPSISSAKPTNVNVNCEPTNDAPATHPLVPHEPLRVLFETEHLAVIAKPAMMPCHNYELKGKIIRPQRNDDDNDDTATTPHPSQTTVLERAMATFPNRPGRIHLVHRLDAGTSGCLLLAFSPEAANALSQSLSSNINASHKTYYALCRGDGESLRARGTFISRGDVKDSKGNIRNAATEIKGLWGSNSDVTGRFCLVRAKLLETGRWHQIRQHLGRENHPIVGEKQHHADRGEIKSWKRRLDRMGLPQRLCLHSHRLVMENTEGENHNVYLPRGGLNVTCPLPEDLRAIIDATEWAGLAREGIPELFAPFPRIQP